MPDTDDTQPTLEHDELAERLFATLLDGIREGRPELAADEMLTFEEGDPLRVLMLNAVLRLVTMVLSSNDEWQSLSEAFCNWIREAMPDMRSDWEAGMAIWQAGQDEAKPRH
jgi:hypothetical protein